MSILTFLCFTSLLYFSAADPVPPVPESSPDLDETQAQIEALTAAIQEVIDKHLTPLLKVLDEENQVYLKETAINGIFGFINYVFNLMEEQTDPKGARAAIDDSVLITFSSSDGYYIAGVPDEAAGAGDS